MGSERPSADTRFRRSLIASCVLVCFPGDPFAVAFTGTGGGGGVDTVSLFPITIAFANDSARPGKVAFSAKLSRTPVLGVTSPSSSRALAGTGMSAAPTLSGPGISNSSGGRGKDMWDVGAETPDVGEYRKDEDGVGQRPEPGCASGGDSRLLCVDAALPGIGFGAANEGGGGIGKERRADTG